MRPWVLLVVVLFVCAGCSEVTTPPEQQETGDAETAENQSASESAGKRAGTSPSQKSNSREQRSPKEILASQYEHINAGEYKAAYELFDAKSQQLVSLEQYRAYFESVAPYEITNHSFASVQVQGERASLVVDLAVSSSTGEQRYRVTQRMGREDGRWRVVMSDEQVACFTATGRPSASA